MVIRKGAKKPFYNWGEGGEGGAVEAGGGRDPLGESEFSFGRRRAEIEHSGVAGLFELMRGAQGLVRGGDVVEKGGLDRRLVDSVGALGHGLAAQRGREGILYRERPIGRVDCEAFHGLLEFGGGREQAPVDAVRLLPPHAAAADAAVLDEGAAFAVIVGERKDEAVAEQLAQRCASAGEALHLPRAAGREDRHRQQLGRVKRQPRRGQDGDIALAFNEQGRQRRRIGARQQFLQFAFEALDPSPRLDERPLHGVEMGRVAQPRRIERAVLGKPVPSTSRRVRYSS